MKIISVSTDHKGKISCVDMEVYGKGEYKVYLEGYDLRVLGSDGDVTRSLLNDIWEFLNTDSKLESIQRSFDYWNRSA